MQNALGVRSEWINGDDVRRRLPMMRFHDAVGATFHDKDGLADPNSVVQGYAGAARRLGAQVLTGTHTIGIDVADGRVQAVRTNRGRLVCRHVVNAAGPWMAQIGDMVGIRIPVVPVRRQMATTTALPDLPADFPFVVDFAQSLYFHREGDGILTGMSNPDQSPGFDQSIDAGWEVTALEAAARRMPMLETRRPSFGLGRAVRSDAGRPSRSSGRHRSTVSGSSAGFPGMGSCTPRSPGS